MATYVATRAIDGIELSKSRLLIQWVAPIAAEWLAVNILLSHANRRYLFLINV